MSTSNNSSFTRHLGWLGVILAVAGFIIVAIPFFDWTDGFVSDKAPDILGWVIFGIGIVFIIVWAIKKLMGRA